MVGEELTHDHRDEMRLGVDRVMMDKLTPTVLHSQFSVRCVPVVEVRKQGEQRKKIHERYVVGKLDVGM